MTTDFAHVRFISAGAGSGKTYYLTAQLEAALVEGRVSPAGVVGTTFTVKAAGELEQRVRKRLITGGRPQLAEQMGQALIGTVHSVCERLLQRFAFELGLSPQLNGVSVEDTQDFFNHALDEVLDGERVRIMNALAQRLAQRDWRSGVKSIADQARGNDLSPRELPQFGQENADSLLRYFTPPVDEDLDDGLKRAIDEALGGIDLTTDATKKTRQYVELLHDARHTLGLANCPWATWITLSKAGAAKKSEPLAAGVREAARYDAHPRFQRDIRHYIQELFNIAGEALERFQALKTERGLIDFTDMEQLVLHALDNAQVKARLGEALELLLIDEFQDTNPMQLALFMKLAPLANEVILVGDVKQAIYAFRGCDPDLVFQTLEGLAKGGGETDVLPSSWRSRPALVHYINQVFSAAFDGEIPSERVVLRPEREEHTDAPAVIRWSLAGRTDQARALALAEGIAALVRRQHPVVDPDTAEVRPVRWSDIAVLATTNARVETIARALRACRIPMKMTLSGLLQVPEVCLAKACLRRVNDASDTLATAEIVALASGSEPQAWLSERLKWLQEHNESCAWGEASHPIIRKLAALRAEVARQSPLETVTRVLNYVGVREVVTAWGPEATKAAQRHRNLDAFLNLAVEYENHCEAQHEAATLTGFLLWLENPRSPQLDLQPTVTTGDAVHVLTHHRSKGLEWPVVITTDFFYTWQPRLWEVRVESINDDFDVDQPLAARALRYWPYVFGNQSTGIAVLDRIQRSEEGLHCTAKNESELRRLAYVSMTRARDLLVIPLPDKSPPQSAWLNTLRVDHLLPQGETLALPDGNTLPTSCETVQPADAAPEPLAYCPQWFVAKEPTTKAVSEMLNPSNAEPVDNAIVVQRFELGERIDLHGADDMVEIGLGLHAVIAAELINPGRPDANELALAILERRGVEKLLKPEDALACASRFREFLFNQFNASQILAEFPVSHALGNHQVVKGWIDVLAETNQGWLIIDHKSSPRPKSQWEQAALAYSGQLKAYQDALEAAGKPVAGCWVHFPVSGGLVEVSWRTA